LEPSTQESDDSDITEEGVIVRLREGRIVGLTILNASKRVPQVTSKLKPKLKLTIINGKIIEQYIFRNTSSQKHRSFARCFSKTHSSFFNVFFQS